MSQLQYSLYAGFGEEMSALYSQAVRIPAGETVTISGQGGWDRTTSQVHTDLTDEINQAFDNVNTALVQAGADMSSVYKLVYYYAPLTSEAMTIARQARQKWFPNHRPLITAIGVEKLAFPGMRIEIEAWAYLGEKK